MFMLLKKFFWKNSVERLMIIGKFSKKGKTLKNKKDQIHSEFLEIKRLQSEIVNSPREGIKDEITKEIFSFLHATFGIGHHYWLDDR